MPFIGYELDAPAQIQLVAPINAVEGPGRRRPILVRLERV